VQQKRRQTADQDWVKAVQKAADHPASWVHSRKHGGDAGQSRRQNHRAVDAPASLATPQDERQQGPYQVEFLLDTQRPALEEGQIALIEDQQAEEGHLLAIHQIPRESLGEGAALIRCAAAQTQQHKAVHAQNEVVKRE